MRTSIFIVLYIERYAGKTYWSWTTVVGHLTHIVSSWYHTEPDSVHRGAALTMHTDTIVTQSLWFIVNSLLSPSKHEAIHTYIQNKDSYSMLTSCHHYHVDMWHTQLFSWSTFPMIIYFPLTKQSVWKCWKSHSLSALHFHKHCSPFWYNAWWDMPVWCQLQDFT